MDSKAMLEGMKKLKSAIEDFIDNVELDEAEKESKPKKKDPKKKDSKEEPGKKEDSIAAASKSADAIPNFSEAADVEDF